MTIMMMRRGRELGRIGTVVMIAVPVAIGVTIRTVGIAIIRIVVVAIVRGGPYRGQHAVFAAGESFLDETEPADPDCDDDD